MICTTCKKITRLVNSLDWCPHCGTLCSEEPQERKIHFENCKILLDCTENLIKTIKRMVNYET